MNIRLEIFWRYCGWNWLWHSTLVKSVYVSFRNFCPSRVQNERRGMFISFVVSRGYFLIQEAKSIPEFRVAHVYRPYLKGKKIGCQRRPYLWYCNIATSEMFLFHCFGNLIENIGQLANSILLCVPIRGFELKVRNLLKRFL